MHICANIKFSWRPLLHGVSYGTLYSQEKHYAKYSSSQRRAFGVESLLTNYTRTTQ